jgi:hypothetical protein
MRTIRQAVSATYSYRKSRSSAIQSICRDALQLYGNAQLSFLQPLKV